MKTGLQKGKDPAGAFQVLPLVGKCPWTVRKTPVFLHSKSNRTPPSSEPWKTSFHTYNPIQTGFAGWLGAHLTFWRYLLPLSSFLALLQPPCLLWFLRHALSILFTLSQRFPTLQSHSLTLNSYVTTSENSVEHCLKGQATSLLSAHPPYCLSHQPTSFHH